MLDGLEDEDDFVTKATVVDDVAINKKAAITFEDIIIVIFNLMEVNSIQYISFLKMMAGSESGTELYADEYESLQTRILSSIVVLQFYGSVFEYGIKMSVTTESTVSYPQQTQQKVDK